MPSNVRNKRQHYLFTQPVEATRKFDRFQLLSLPCSCHSNISIVMPFSVLFKLKQYYTMNVLVIYSYLPKPYIETLH